MAYDKAWYASKGVWGSLITAVYTVLMIAGVSISDAISADQVADQVVGFVDAAVLLAGTVLAGYGRITATAKIGGAK